jgi:ankyrin repeat protein
MNRQLPTKPSLENLKNQAKQLLKQQRDRSSEAARRIREALPDFRSRSDERIFGSDFGLQHAQAVVAREYGFKSWTHLKRRLASDGPLPPWKKLRNAIEADDVAMVSKLAGNDPALLDLPIHEGEDEYFNQRHTALPYAVQRGKVRVVRHLADAFPALVHRADHRGRTPINTLIHVMATACAGLTPPRQEIYDFLKSRGAKPDLNNAAKANDGDSVRDLLRQGADPYANASGRLAEGCAFVVAADAGHADIVKLFLEQAAPDPEIAFNAISRALLVNHWAVIGLLEPLIPRERLGECLCGCCEFLNLEGVEFLLQHGADPNIPIRPDDPRSYPLLIALDTYSRKPWRGRLIETLIAAGATQWEPSPQMAIHRSQPDLLAEFLDADPTLVHRRFPDENRAFGGGTLLHLAAEYYELDCVRLLLDRGANLEARSPTNENGLGGVTPIFHVAASYKHHGLPVLREFLARGAKLDAEARLTHTPPGARPREEPRTVTPLGWVRWVSSDWPDDSAAEEIRLLREAGAAE